jgi:hypothetical protein
MNNLSPLQSTRHLLFFTVAILVVFGIGSLLRIFGNPDRAYLYVFNALIMFGDAVAMLSCVLMLNIRKPYAFVLSIVVLTLNIFPMIFDQFGFVDLLFLLVNLIALVVLIMARKEILPT